jgi:hypothetical protein
MAGEKAKRVLKGFIVFLILFQTVMLAWSVWYFFGTQVWWLVVVMSIINFPVAGAIIYEWCRKQIKPL